MATAITAAFPDLVLPAGATITVTLSDALGKITKLNVFGPSGVFTVEPDVPVVPPVFPYAPGL